MKVSDIMKTPVAAIRHDATICEAVRLLCNTGAMDLPVVDEAGDLVGVVSEADIVRLILPTYQDLTAVDAALLDPTLMQDKALGVRSNPVSSVMTTDVVTLQEHDSVLKAASTMLRRRIRRIPVVRDGRPVGSVSRIDILDAVMRGGL